RLQEAHRSGSPCRSRSRRARRLRPSRKRRPRSALRVERELLAHDLLVDPGADVLLETIGQGQEQLVDPFVLDQLGQERLRLSAVVPPEKLTNRVERDLPLEVQIEIFEQVPHKLF